MSKFLGLTKRCFRQKPVKKQLNESLAHKLGFIICFLVIILSAIYLKEVNGMATMGFKLQELESKTEELERQNKKLKLGVIELQALDRLGSAARELGMVEVGDLDYLIPQAEKVAVK